MGGVRFFGPLIVSGQHISGAVSRHMPIRGGKANIFDGNVSPAYQANFPHDLVYIGSRLGILLQHRRYESQRQAIRVVEQQSFTNKLLDLV